MSLYSNEVNNLAQHTEGFECGLDVNDNLHMLSDSEQALYDDAKKVNDKTGANIAAPIHNPAPVEEDSALDDSIYEEPSGHVTFADSGLAPVDADDSDVEGFANGSIIDTIKSYIAKILAFIKANWMSIFFILLAIGAAYYLMYGTLPFMNKMNGVFNLGDSSSSFRGSSSSLGEIVSKQRVR